jgi:fluoride exporter
MTEVKPSQPGGDNPNSVAPVERRWLGLVILGGMAGATTRWWVMELLGPSNGFPWATFVVNVVGCGLLGALTALVRARPRHQAMAGDLLGIGFCGGLTTMSTFAVEVAEFGRTDRIGLGLTYLTASVVAGVAAAWLGAQTEKRLQEVRS